MKNYDMIHLIQKAGLDKEAESVVVRAFNKMNDCQDHCGCLTISVSICLALEYLKYSPKLCIGKFWVNGHDFYHAWVELDNKIIDVAIYGNTAFSPFWHDGIIKPQVNVSYDNADITYEPFTFDDDFKDADISKMVGKTFFYYCDHAPNHNAIWNLILYFLDTSSTTTLSSIKELSRNHIIGEGGDDNV